jgi:S1-C subfamily serine protease
MYQTDVEETRTVSYNPPWEPGGEEESRDEPTAEQPAPGPGGDSGGWGSHGWSSGDWLYTPLPGAEWAPAGGADSGGPRPWRRAAVALAVLVLVLASGGLGAAIGVAVHDRGTAGAFQPSDLPTIPSLGGGGSTPTTVAPTAGIDANAVASKVDPAVVDINTTLGGGGRAAGTGIVLTSNGVVLTNNHVIADARTIQVQIGGTGRTYAGRVVGYDVIDDVAVVQLQGASGLKTATLGNSSSLSVGTPVVAIGNALGQGGTPQATEGTVTALDQTITVQGDITPGETLNGLIQFNAPIQSGDSGGPLVDAQGRVVGMDTAAAFGGGGFRSRLAPSDAGFAIPINTALPIAQRIGSGKVGGNVHIGPRPLIGVEVSDVGGSQSGGGFGDSGGFGSQTPSAPVSSGALVQGVSAGTPAASIGLAAGDVIVSLGGQTITDSAGLSAAILQYKVGDTVSVGWVDPSGNHHTADATLVAGPPA